jgi:hypothetical protein
MNRDNYDQPLIGLYAALILGQIHIKLYQFKALVEFSLWCVLWFLLCRQQPVQFPHCTTDVLGWGQAGRQIIFTHPRLVSISKDWNKQCGGDATDTHTYCSNMVCHLKIVDLHIYEMTMIIHTYLSTYLYQYIKKSMYIYIYTYVLIHVCN